MSFLSIPFFLFFIVLFVIYYAVKPEYRYIILFIGSYVFYGYAAPRMLLVLIGVTLISYLGGLVLDKWRSNVVYAAFFGSEIAVLLIFKYSGFILPGIEWNIVVPIGLSYMVFQSCSYLAEVYRERIVVERNPVRYATFVAFFPTVMSGPIQKARNLLPQISAPAAFDSERAIKGTTLFIWGAFEKIMVANGLSPVYSDILTDYQNRSSMELLIGAVAFSLFIYADFSGYSDMARGVALILGIDVGRNFNNPYLSRTTAEFWNRWHVSLNEWFLENVYIPLGGNRRGTVRKYINVMIVFLISGLWHGANWHFVVWGAVNGLLVIIGLMLRPVKAKIYDKLNLSSDILSISFLERCIVFLMITMTWVFFSSGISESLGIIRRIVCFDFHSVFNHDLLSIAGTHTSTFFLMVAILFFCIIQVRRQDEDRVFTLYRQQPLFIQSLLMAAMICICVFGAFNTEAHVNMDFLYFSF